MTTLQRSSVSFRRQGSSGRIWDDRLQVQALDSKTSDSNERDEKALVSHERHQGSDFKETKTANSRPLGSSTRSIDDRKVQRFSLSALFGRCIGSSTA